MRKFLSWVTLAVAVPSLAAAQQTKFRLQGDEQPDQLAWNQPASVNYTFNNAGADSYTVDLAARLDRQIVSTRTDTMFVRGVVHKTNQQKKEKELYSGEIGYHFEYNTVNENETDQSSAPERNALSIFVDTSIAYASKAKFPDGTADCTVTPLPPACGTQHEQSLRVLLSAQPFRMPWETTFGYSDETHTMLSGPSWTHSIAPVVTFFYDEALNATVNAAGIKETGGISGAKFVFGGAISPRALDYRLILRASIQYIQTFSRPQARAGSFEDSTTLFKVSADYELGVRSFEGGEGWAPAIGVTYTSGEDPLAGQKKQDNIVVGFKLTYKAAK